MAGKNTPTTTSPTIGDGSHDSYQVVHDKFCLDHVHVRWRRRDDGRKTTSRAPRTGNCDKQIPARKRRNVARNQTTNRTTRTQNLSLKSNSCSQSQQNNQESVQRSMDSGPAPTRPTGASAAVASPSSSSSLIFLGTGCSGALPDARCLIQPSEPPCTVCCTALSLPPDRNPNYR